MSFFHGPTQIDDRSMSVLVRQKLKKLQENGVIDTSVNALWGEIYRNDETITRIYLIYFSFLQEKKYL